MRIFIFSDNTLQEAFERIQIAWQAERLGLELAVAELGYRVSGPCVLLGLGTSSSLERRKPIMVVSDHN
ncbi:hypothetical protein BSK56_33095 [Paenibacillus borealis]|uniref:Uncharacterized protein n=1 Tax=Paenibacillus borealis TaxID=160799 RepID=A0ABX3GS21_PAEBO|nr:hypothetical protein [Paenibacillus borealis]OMD35306.1 hypothetical protein BSK56_33095 [Paenibacillus borealis]